MTRGRAGQTTKAMWATARTCALHPRPMGSGVTGVGGDIGIKGWRWPSVGAGEQGGSCCRNLDKRCQQHGGDREKIFQGEGMGLGDGLEKGGDGRGGIEDDSTAPGLCNCTVRGASPGEVKA